MYSPIQHFLLVFPLLQKNESISLVPMNWQPGKQVGLD